MSLAKAGKQKNEPDKSKQAKLAKERILGIKKDVLNTVESFLEDGVTEEFFLSKLRKLSQSDYDDVIQERNIEHMCGYVLCSNELPKVVKQHYHISGVTNKIYDITERKCFCSNTCYTASKFVKAQLNSLPLYMRKEDDTSKINLISRSDKNDGRGEEFIFHHPIKTDEIEKPVIKKPPQPYLNGILQDDVKSCAEQLSSLTIKEKVYDKVYTFDEKKSQAAKNHASSSSEGSGNSDDDDDDDQALFPDSYNASVLRNKQMPILDVTKQAKLISPMIARDTPQSASIQISSDFVLSIFRDWFTEDTLKYLLGEERLFAMKADVALKADNTHVENRSALKTEYVNLSLKVDKLPDVDDVEGELDNRVTISVTDCTSGISNKGSDHCTIQENVSSLKTKFKRRQINRGKIKKVVKEGDVSSEMPEQWKGVLSGDLNEKNSEPDSSFPLIDSISQNEMRKEILTNRLKSVYLSILPSVGFHFQDIWRPVKIIVDTFSLTPTNVIFKPKELKCIAVVLFRVLSRTVVTELNDDSKFCKLVDLLTFSSLTVNSIEDIITRVLSIQEL